MNRLDELIAEMNQIIAEADADPDADETVKAARSARAGEILDEMTAEMQRLTEASKARTAQILAETAAMERRTELLRWKTAELNELTARAERGELSREEALEALIRFGFANDAEGLAD